MYINCNAFILGVIIPFIDLGINIFMSENKK